MFGWFRSKDDEDEEEDQEWEDVVEPVEPAESEKVVAEASAVAAPAEAEGEGAVAAAPVTEEVAPEAPAAAAPKAPSKVNFWGLIAALVAAGYSLYMSGLWDTVAAHGTDLSWLKGASCELKVVPGEDMLDGVLAVSLNDTQLAHVLFSADLATQMAYISIPEYFDQTIAFKPGEVLESLLSGAASSENGGSMQTQILQMIMGTGMEIVSQLQQYFTSIPADVWQQEMMNYVMPIMNNLTQESESGVLTVGSLKDPSNTPVEAVNFTVKPAAAFCACFAIELTDLPGREALKDYPVETILKY